MTDRSPRRRAVVLLAGAVVLALVALVAAWAVGYHRAVQVTATTGAPECTGTTPTTWANPSGSDLTEVAIPLRKGFTCRLRIRIDNWSDADLHVGRVTVPVGGTDGGASFRILDIDGRPLEGSDIDAVADLDFSLEPGPIVIELGVAFRASGCTDDGAVQTFPTIQVESMLASHDVRVSDLPVFLGTDDSDCSDRQR